MNADEKLPPFNEDAEESVLGAILIDPGALIRVAPIVKPEDFWLSGVRMVYSSMLKMSDEKIAVDLLTLEQEMREAGTLEAAGGLSFLGRLLNVVPTSIHAEHYAKIVANLAIRRRLIDACNLGVQLAWDETNNLDQVLASVQEKILKISRAGGRGMLLKDHASVYYDDMEAILQGDNLPPGLKTGFSDIDAILRGLRGMVILASRPSMGKSSLAREMAINVAKAGGKVAWFSLEDDAQMVMHRIVAGEIQQDVADLRDGKVGNEFEFMRCIARMADGDLGKNLWLDDSPSLTIAEIRARTARAIAELNGLDLVVVDYLQLAQSGRNLDRRLEVEAISTGLKDMGRTLGVSVLALSQLSRSCESRNDKRPMLSDLRESGALEQDADVVMFIYRDEMYNPDTTDARGLADIIIAKHRNGPIGTATLMFKATTASFKTAVVYVNEF